MDFNQTQKATTET